MMSLWRSHEFVKLWVGQTISEIGSRVSREGIPLTAVLILRATPGEMGMLTALGGFAALVAGPAAGWLADRTRRKPLMIAADLGRAMLLALIPIAYAQDALSLSLLFTVSAMVGMLTVLFDVAYPTFVPTLVDEAQLLEANAKLALTQSVAEVTGPTLTGLLIKLVSAPIAILIDAVSFVASAISILWIGHERPVTFAPAGEDASWWSEASAGFRFVFAHPLLRPLAFRTATVSLAWGFFATLYVYYAIEVLKMSTVALGIVITLGGIGNLVGALLARHAGTRYPLGHVLIAAAVWQGLLSLLIPLASEPGWFSILCMGASQLFGDVAHPLFNINELTLRQKAAPPALLGRVNACLQLLLKGLFPFGALLGGMLAGRVGVRATLLICSLGILSSSLWLIFSPIRRLQGHGP